jgi:hypothetical protein
VQLNTAVLAQGVGKLERVELDIGVAVGEPLYQRLDGIFCARLRVLDLVADVEDQAPVFAREVLVCSLDCELLAHAPTCVSYTPTHSRYHFLTRSSLTHDVVERILLRSEHAA